MLEVLIPTPVPAHIRLPENYTADHSRQFADYPIRVNGNTSYDPKKNDLRPSILTEHLITNTD